MSLNRRISRLFYSPINYFLLRYKSVKYLNYPNINGLLTIRGDGDLSFGHDITINSSYSINPVGMAYKTAFYITKGSRVILGDNVGVSNTLFFSKCGIKVEDNVLIGGGCQLLDSDFHPISYMDRLNNNTDCIKSGEILIKEGAFIGANTIILKNSTIGERSVVAAGSVVTGDIPSNEIWGGNPIRYIKNINQE